MPSPTTPTAWPAAPEWLQAAVPQAHGLGVDRQAAIIHGYVVAETGEFKTEGRGQFDLTSLEQIQAAINATPKGLKSRFTHPGLSSDGLGKFLGRARDARLDGSKLRADLHLDPSSFKTPSGDLATYVMDLAESDPDAFSSSLVMKADKRVVLESGTDRDWDPVKDEELTPTWRMGTIHASDVVDTGDAAGAFLDADHLPDQAVRQGGALLDELFAGQARDVTAARLSAYLDRYLDARYGPETTLEENQMEAKLLAALATLELIPADATDDLATAALAGYCAAKGLAVPTDTDAALAILEPAPAGPDPQVSAALVELQLAPASASPAVYQAALAGFCRAKGLELPADTDAALAILTDPPIPPTPPADPAAAATLAERTRAEEITAACRLQNLDDLAGDMIKAGLNLDQARLRIVEQLAARNLPAGDGGDPTPPHADPDKEYKDEFADQAATLAELGCSEADYVRTRRIDAGLESVIDYAQQAKTATAP